VFHPRSIQWPLGLLLFGFAIVPLASLAFQAEKPAVGTLPPPVKLSPQDDHQRLMDILHITEVRRGRDGNNC